MWNVHSHYTTVKVSEIPPPRRLITTPSNTWIRSRVPSMIRTCTRKVSPGRNVGKSRRAKLYYLRELRGKAARIKEIR